MNTQTFLDNLKSYSDRFTETSQIPSDFFDFFESNYETYTSATPEERERIRRFVHRPEPFLKRLFQSRERNKSQISQLLLSYVKDRVLPKLKSTQDKEWLVRGLVAMSIENLTGKFYDQKYLGLYTSGSAAFLVIDLYVTAEENGIDPKPIVKNIAKISNSKEMGSIGRIMTADYAENSFHERRTKGKWVGISFHNFIE